MVALKTVEISQPYNGYEIHVDKEELLTNFAKGIKDGTYSEKLPYNTWRELKYNEAETLIIRFYEGFSSSSKDGSYNDRIGIYYKNNSLNKYVEAYNSFHYQNGSLTPYNDFVKFIDIEYNYNIRYDRFYGGNITYNPTIPKSCDYYHNTLTTTTASTTTKIDDTITSYIDEAIQKVNNNKENKTMKTNDLFNFDFGPVSSAQFRLSPYGIAVATKANGWVSYNSKTGEVFNVDIINVDVSKMIYKMPVAMNSISVGDILVHSGAPVFVRALNSNGTVSVLNYTDSTVVDIVPVKSPFGFNFFTKVCALIDFSGLSANSDNPFGNMLPFLMLKDGDSDFDFTTLLLFSSMNGNSNGGAFNNPLLFYFLMSQNGKKNDMLPFLLMMNGNSDFLSLTPKHDNNFIYSSTPSEEKKNK